MRDGVEGKGRAATEGVIADLRLYTAEHGSAVPKQGIEGPMVGEEQKSRRDVKGHPKPASTPFSAA
jgi:hypothetical protein